MTPSERPAFGLGLRGYSRAEVDAHVARAAAELEQVRDELQRATHERDAAQEALAQAQRVQAQAAQDAEARVQQTQRERDVAVEEVDRLQQEATRAAAAATPDPYPVHPTDAPTDTPADSAPAPARAVPSPARPPLRLLGGQPLPGARKERRRALGVPLLLLLLTALVAGVVGFVSRDGGGSAASPSVEPSVAPSVEPSVAPSVEAEEPLAAADPAQPVEPAPPAPAQAAPLPAGWSTQRADDGSWTVGVPDGWTAVGQGADRSFVSESGLTTMWVRTAPLAAAPSPAEIEGYEAAFAAENPGYERLAAGPTEHLGNPAGTWDYVHGAGPDQRRGSDLGVLVGERGYWLHVESRASSWRFAEPLVESFRETFVPS